MTELTAAKYPSFEWAGASSCRRLRSLGCSASNQATTRLTAKKRRLPQREAAPTSSATTTSHITLPGVVTEADDTADVARAVGKAGSTPPWQCPGPGAGEVVSLPFALSAVYEFRCEAKLPGSDVGLCDECWAARRRRVSS